MRPDRQAGRQPKDINPKQQRNAEMTDTAENLWFMTAQLIVRMAQNDNDNRLSIIEHRMAKDFAPPLHVHHKDSETFVILEGRFRFQNDGAVFEADVGDTIHLPKGSTHGFRVLSDYGRCLTITDGPFEDMVRAAARPAAANGLPEQLPPTLEQQQALAAICAAHAIDLVGAPIA
jgi:quercetin dioxygenase-like cupin family protein